MWHEQCHVRPRQVLHSRVRAVRHVSRDRCFVTTVSAVLSSCRRTHQASNLALVFSLNPCVRFVHHRKMRSRNCMTWPRHNSDTNPVFRWQVLTAAASPPPRTRCCSPRCPRSRDSAWRWGRRCRCRGWRGRAWGCRARCRGWSAAA